MWHAGLGDRRRRASGSSCSTAPPPTRPPADNPGLLPEQILGPVVNFVDAARPLVSALGPRQLPSGSWSRPQDHPAHPGRRAVGGEDRARRPQDDRSARSPSPPRPTAATSTSPARTSTGRSRRSWTSSSTTSPASTRSRPRRPPSRRSDAGATAGPTIPTDAATAAAVAAALWAAAGDRVHRHARARAALIAVCRPDMLGIVGPLFAAGQPAERPVDRVHRQRVRHRRDGRDLRDPGRTSPPGSRRQDACSCSPPPPSRSTRTASARCRSSSRRVLGVQVAYAGYFADAGHAGHRHPEDRQDAMTPTNVERLDAPNQQVVRPDGSGPADEGEGGSRRRRPKPNELDAMTKAELLGRGRAAAASRSTRRRPRPRSGRPSRPADGLRHRRRARCSAADHRHRGEHRRRCRRAWTPRPRRSTTPSTGSSPSRRTIRSPTGSTSCAASSGGRPTTPRSGSSASTRPPYGRRATRSCRHRSALIPLKQQWGVA